MSGLIAVCIRPVFLLITTYQSALSGKSTLYSMETLLREFRARHIRQYGIVVIYRSRIRRSS